MRKWRLRGRRGQVAAVATILGLLLVVTFIANYLTTTLPSQMSVNELDHVVQVENQLGRLQAELQAATAYGAVGAELTQPVTLGSSGDPPFAPADVGTIGPANSSTGFTVAYLNYSPPWGGTAGGYSSPSSSCIFALTTMTCTGAATVLYNWTGTPVAPGYVLSETGGGTYNLNVTTSGTTALHELVAITMTHTAIMNLLVLGSNDSISFSLSGVGSQLHIIVDGSYDSVTFASPNAENAQVLMVGVHDSVAVTGTVGGAFVLLSSFFGATDSVTVTTGSIASGSIFAVYYNSYTTASPRPSCPVLSLAPTDTVAGGVSGSGAYYVTYNDSTSVTVAPPPVWWNTWVLTPAVICPFYYPVYETQSSSGIDVHLYNTYIPAADVAFDQGAIVYAQPGGVPILVDGPEITANITHAGVLNSMNVVVPQFTGTFGTDSGIATTEITTRLISLNSVQLTSFNNPLPGVTTLYVYVAVTTTYASGWAAYYNSTTPFQTHWRCIGSTVACVGPYPTTPTIGSAVIWLATTTSTTTVNIALPTFAVSLL
jgi:hypothetical protein